MSKIGKKSIQIPSGVEIKIDLSAGGQAALISVKGPKGELKRMIDSSMSVSVDGDKLKVSPKKGDAEDKKLFALWGLTRVLINNMIEGVVNSFEKKLEFEGVGYKANVKGDQLELSLGYSHPVYVKTPAGISFKVEKNVIIISGIDKELVGHVAAEIKSKRLPEPYKGSGIKYAGEIIRRKAGKKAATAA